MYYLKRNTKFSILVFLIIVLSITIAISTLAKTEVYFSPSDTLQILSTTSQKPEVQIVNVNSASQDELIKVLQIGELLARKIITFREELRGFKKPQDLIQLPELTNIDWRE